MKEFCKYGHPTRLRADREANGYCRECRKLRSKQQYRTKKHQDQRNRQAAVILAALTGKQV